MVNGTLVLKFTDLVLPGNAGMDLRFIRQYRSGLGWEFGVEGIPIGSGDPDDPLECCDYPVFGGAGIEERSFPESGVMGTAPVYLTQRFWKYTVATRTLELPNGWVGTYDADTGGLLQELHDRFGNSVTFTYSASRQLQSVTQHLGNGQTRTVSYSPHAAMPTSMTYGTRTWNFQWNAQNRLTAVQPPAGPGWQFGYTIQTPSECWGWASANGFPETVTVTTPYGATALYQFIVRQVPGTEYPPLCIPTISSRTLGGPGLTPATWSFDIPLLPGPYPTFTVTSSVTTPLGRTVSFTHHTYKAWSTAMGTVLSAQFLTRKVIAGGGLEAVIERTPTVLPFIAGLSEPVISREDVTVDGVLHRTDFAYDGSGPFNDYHRPRQTTETATGNPASRVTTRTFDYDFGPRILDRVKSETVLVDGEAHTTTTEYENETGFPIQRIANGISTYFDRDARGNVWREIGPFVTTFTYDWGVLQDTQTPAYTISRAINPDGTLASETRGGYTTAYEFDAIGRPTVMAPPVGETANTVYDDANRKVTVCRGSECTETVHDGIGRPTSVTNPAGVTTITKYDQDGRKIFDGYPGGGETGGDTIGYDALNRVTSVCHPGSSCRSLQYGPNTVTITDENDHVTVQRFRAFGDPFDRRLTGLRDAECDDPACEWTYSYTALGALKRVDGPEGPDRIWNYDFNGHHILGSDIQPESGRTYYDYDAAGRLTWKTDAQGRSLRHWYDWNSRLSKIELPGTSEYIEFEYDASDNRTRVKTALVDSTFKYDGANRLTDRTDTIEGRTFETTYEYDGKDHLRKIVYPSGREVIYTPDPQGRIVSVTGPGGATLATNVQYHASGAISGFTFGNGTTEAITFDARHRPQHLVSGPAAGPLDLTYQYDDVGNVEEITDPRPGFSASFLYDALDRLTVVSGFGARVFEYDRLGNRRRKFLAAGEIVYTYDPDTQRLVSISGSPEAATLTYDAVGNLKTDGTGTYSYTAFNLMATATIAGATTSYGYDGDNQRKRKETPDGVRYFIHGPGGQIIAEYRETAGGPALVREYIYLGTKLLASSSRETPPAGGRVTAVAVAPQSVEAGSAAAVTISGATEPCSKVEVDFGDGTVTPYTIASPYQLPLVVTHTYASPGVYTVVARGQTGASGPCLGVVSAPVEVTSIDVVANGDFSQVDENGLPVGWGIFEQGGQGYWNASSGVLHFYRTAGMTQAVVLQYTGLALPAGAPLELTFQAGNTDTVRKRLSVMIHTPTFDDLALCTFWLDPGQPLLAYAMRMHATTTTAWADASASFYAADVNAPGNTGAYLLDHVTLRHRPAANAAKTDCVDPLAPASGGEVRGNVLVNTYFTNPTIAPWSTEGGLAYQLTNETLEFHRNGSPPRILQATSEPAAENQRLSAVFELGNTSTTRQRLTVTLQDASGSDFTNCMFWLAPGAPKRFYAMTTYAGVAWATATIAIAPATGGSPAALQWLQLDTVMLSKVTAPTLGTECFEPGSFILEGGAPAPAPVPAPASAPAPDVVPVQGSGHTRRPATIAAFPRSPGPWLSDASTAVFLEGEASDAPASVPVVPPPAPLAQPVTVSVTGTGTGLVTSSPAGLTCGPYEVTCTGWFAEGATVTLTATPDAGQVFVGWTGACTGTGPCVVAIVGPQTVGALFGAPVEFYHLDVLGSVRMITNSAGAVVTRRDYLAFGEETGALTGDPRRFTGKELDPETALQYFGARYYRSVVGRFTTIDPGQASGSPADPQGWNAYAYARNNPLRFIDPDGRTYALRIEGFGLSTVDDADWQPMIRNPGRAFRIEGDMKNGKIWALVNGFWKFAGTYAWIGPDPGSLEGLVGDIANRSRPGVDAALAIGAIGAAPIAATMAPGGGLTTLGRVAINASRLEHIFGKARHNLAGLLARFASREAALLAVQRATESVVLGKGLSGLFEERVNIKGTIVTVTGNVINGVVHIATMWIR